jgi:hypothetical protein
MPKARADVHGPPPPLVAGLCRRDQRRHAGLKTRFVPIPST